MLVDGEGGRLARLLEAVGGRVRSVSRPGSPARLDAADGSADLVIGCWSVFRAPSPDEIAEADRVLRPDGRLLVVHDYGRDDVSHLRGPFLANGFRVRVIHCFWTFGSADEADVFLSDAFGTVGCQVSATLTRPRLSYNVAVYHRTRGGAGAPA